MDVIGVLSKVELFDGLRREELEAVARICRERRFRSGDVITRQGEAGSELFVICDGFVEVVLSGSGQNPSPRTVVNLGRGQLFGEMALVDFGPRSATVRAVKDDTVLQVIDREDFNRLCEGDYHLGYTVMRNMAADLSFKLRHWHLAGR
jgi:CRP-like cAMP-binding protein